MVPFRRDMDVGCSYTQSTGKGSSEQLLRHTIHFKQQNIGSLFLISFSSGRPADAIRDPIEGPVGAWNNNCDMTTFGLYGGFA